MKRKIAIYLVLAAAFGLAALYLALRYEPLPERLTIQPSRMIEYRDGSPMCVFLSEDDKWRIPVSLDEVDPDFVTALLAYEDKRFHHHLGVDPVAVARSAVLNIRARRVVTGASTLTMQLARMLEPRPRTFTAKIADSFRALQLEMRFSKREILELYLQFAPYGSNLEGIEAASMSFFGHRASHLSSSEIAYLLGVTQSPEARFPKPGNEENIRESVKKISRKLYRKKIFTREQLDAALAAKAPEGTRNFPRENLHAAYYLYSREPGARVRSSIDRSAQAMCASALERHRSQLAGDGVFNASAVVIDNKSGEVIAAAGNFDFWDQEHQGQVIGFLAPRSPGSAMKPFIYALAIDRGQALPGFIFPDVQLKWGDYEPGNFDDKFRGLVRFDDALSQSLNIPFIAALDRLGLPAFISFLSGSEVTTIEKAPGYYGLSAAVGGMEINLVELTNLYAMLGRGGEWREASWTLKDAGPGRQLISPGAAYLTRRTLRRKDRPDFPARRAFTANAPSIFWKTGTSAHFRDAWALGGAADYTAGVWAGNFDGSGSRELVGQHSSGPILFDILEALPARSALIAEKPPSDLIKIEVCAFSGRPAGPSCPERKTALALINHIPTETCPFHHEYTIDVATGQRLSPLCRAGRETETKVFTVLPAAYRKGSRDPNITSLEPPPLARECPAPAAAQPPTITSPRDGMVYFLVPGLPAGKQEIPLEADVSARESQIFWFIDGRYLGSTSPGQKLWFPPSPGIHEIRLLDSSGQADTLTITVVSGDPSQLR